MCGNCIDQSNWQCSYCMARPTSQNYSAPSQFSTVTWLFFVAFAAIFIGVLLIAFGSLAGQNGVSGGAVILIGPIPIILGNGPYSLWLIVVAAVVTIASLVFFLFFLFRRRA